MIATQTIKQLMDKKDDIIVMLKDNQYTYPVSIVKSKVSLIREKLKN